LVYSSITFAKGIAVNAQSFGGFGKIVVMAVKNFKNEVLSNSFTASSKRIP